MTDDELLKRVREHYARTLETTPVPPFDDLAADATRAATGGGRWHRPAAGMGVAAALVLAVLAARHDAAPPLPGAADPEVARLVADLTSSTHWQAPSDRALTTAVRPSDLGVPDLQPKTFHADEVRSWL